MRQGAAYKMFKLPTNRLISFKPDIFAKLSFMLFPVLMILSLDGKSQSCGGYMGIIGTYSIFNTDKLCAPVTATWEVGYTNVDYGATPANAQIRIAWGDGSIIDYPYQVGAYPILNKLALINGVTHEVRLYTTHTYPSTNTQCRYELEVCLLINGDSCKGTIRKQLVLSWNNEQDGQQGELLVEETVTNANIYRICENETATITFTDRSTFNCVPPDEADVPNNQKRWIRFLYGTYNNAGYAARGRIPNMKVNGIFITDASGNLINNLNGNGLTEEYYGGLSILPGPVTSSGLQTYSIIIPAAGKVSGQVFEITLQNWNYCNPYDTLGPPPGRNGDYAPKTTTAIIEVITAPPDLGAINSNFCIGDNLSVTVNPSLPGGTIQWYTDLATTNLVGTLPTFNPSTTPPLSADRLSNTVAGTKTYYVTEALGPCESDPAPVVFVVRNSLTTTGPITCSKAANLCPGETGITYSVPNVPPNMTYGGATEYVWSVPAGWSITAGQGTKTITVTVGTTTGSQTVSVYLQYATDPRCPASSVSLAITVNVLPGANIGPTNLSYCNSQSGSNPDVVINSLVGQTPLTVVYEWNAGANSKSITISVNTTDNPLPWPGAGTETTYTLKSVTDVAGCVVNAPHANLTGSCLVKIREVLAQPPLLTGPTGVCSGEQNVIYTLPTAPPTQTVGGTTRYRYQETNTSDVNTDWLNYNDGTVTNYDNYQTDNDQMIDVLTHITQVTRRLKVRLEYTTTVTSGSRCESSYRNNDITIYPLPDVVISGSTTICSGTSATLTFTVTNGPVNLTYTDGTSTFNLNNVSTVTANTGALTASKTYTVTAVTRATAPACSGTYSGSAVVTVNQLPTAGTDDPDGTICQGSDFTFDIDLTGVAGGNFIVGYKINAGATIYTPEFDEYTYHLTIPAAWLTPGAENTITLVSVTQNVGVASPCSGTIVVGQEEVKVTVNRTPSVANAGPDQSLCATLVSNPFNASAPAGAWEYGTWQKVSGPGAVVFLPDVNTRTATANITAGQEGVYEFQWIITSGVCPVTRDTLTVDFGVSPTVDAGGPYDHCFPALPALAASNSAGTGVWSKVAGPGNLTFDGLHDVDAEVTADVDGVYTIQWTVTSGACVPVSDNATLTIWPLPVVTSQPVNDIICDGGNASFSILPNNLVNYDYQWQKDEGSGYFNISDGAVYNGSNTANLTITNAGTAMSGFKYRCILTEKLHSCSQTSDEATLTVHPYPAVTDDPDNRQVCDGGSTWFAVGHSAAIPSYQWQVSTDGGGTWNNLSNSPVYSGVDSDTLRLTSIPFAYNTWQYRCVVTQAALCSTNSSAATLTVYQYPAITDNPDNSEICENDNASFTIDATGGVLTFQWQIFNGTGYTDLIDDATYSGVTTKTLGITAAPATLNAKKYRCKITESGLCSSYTTDGVLTVHAYPTVNTHPSNDVTCETENASFSVTATGVSLSYQWQEDSGSGFADMANGGIVSGATTSTLNLTGVPFANNNYKYRCRITESNLCPVNSNQATLTVHQFPVITTQPVNRIICNAQNTTFSIAATVVSPTYQWQVDPNTGTFVDLTDAGIYSNTNGTTLVLTVATTAYNGFKYRCIVTESTLCQTITDEVTLTVHPYPVINTHPVNDETCTNGNASFFIESTGPSLTWQWEYDNGGGWMNVPVDGIHSQVTNDTLLLASVTDAMNGYKYRCKVTESALCAITSNQAQLVVYQYPTITQATDQETCNGGNASFAIAAPGAAFQWQVKNGMVWDPLSNSGVYSGVNSNTLTLTGVDMSYHGKLYRCIVTQSGICVTPTNPYLLTVHKLPDITSQPGSPSVCNGSGTTIAVMPNDNLEYSYQWQVDKNDGNGFVNVPDDAIYDNNLTAVLKINTTSLAMNGYHYRCRVDSTDTGCTSYSDFGTLTVKPIPVVTQLADINRCANVLTSISAFTSDQDPVNQFRWFNNNTSVYTPAGSGTGNMPSFTTPANGTTGNLTSIIKVVAEKNLCVSDTMQFSINIYPTPVINQLSDTSFCPGINVSLPAFSSVPAGATFTWNNALNQTGIGASGSGSFSVFPSSANFTGVPKFDTVIVHAQSANGCPAVDDTIVLTLKPKPVVGNIDDIYSCPGETVNIPIFTANTAAPTSFEWTRTGDNIGLADASGNTNTIAPFTAVTNNGLSNYSGNFTVYATKDGCKSQSKIFTVFVKPTPQISSPLSHPAVCPGEDISAVFITSIAVDSLRWMINNSDTTGTGTVLPFAAQANTTGSDIVRTLTARAYKTGCVSPDRVFNINIKPTPLIDAISDIYVCPGDSIKPLPFHSVPASDTWQWSCDEPLTGYSSGTTDMPGKIGNNSSADTIAGVVTVTGSLLSCQSLPRHFTIGIKPKPVLNDIAGGEFCPQDSIIRNFSLLQPVVIIPGDSMLWSNSNTLIGLPSSGTGNLAFKAGVNNSGAQYSGLVKLKAHLNGCISSEKTFTLKVNPSPVTADFSPNPANVCASQDTINLNVKTYRVDGTNGTVGSTYLWDTLYSQPDTAIPYTFIYNGNRVTVEFSVYPWQGQLQAIEVSNKGCRGIPRVLTINSYALPIAYAGPDIEICMGQQAFLSGNASGGSGSNNFFYSWTPSSGLDNANSQFPVYSGTDSREFLLQVRDNSTLCLSVYDTVSVTVNPKPDMPAADNVSVCYGIHPILTGSFDPSADSIVWYKDDIDNRYYLGANCPGDTLPGIYYYWVSQFISGCESQKRPVTLTVYAKPDAPVPVAIPATCQGGTIPSLKVTGQNDAIFKWYYNAVQVYMGGNTYNTGQTAPGIYPYEVTQTLSGCESPSCTTTLTINEKPAKPLVADTITCEGDPIPVITVVGNNVKWYHDVFLTNLIATGNNFTPPDTTPTTTAYLYYVTQEVNGCTSDKATQRFTRNPAPDIISAIRTNQTVCNSGDGTIEINVQNPHNPFQFSVYNGIDGSWEGATYPTSPGYKLFTGLSTGNYPVVVKNKFNCSTYGPVLQISAGDAPPAPSAGSPHTYCYGEELDSLWALTNPTGDSLEWYTDILLQNPYGTGPKILPLNYEDTTITYYVRTIKGGCPGPASSVTITINPIPPPPAVRDTFMCEGGEVPPLPVSGSGLEWFADVALTVVLSPSQPEDVSEGLHSYYVRQNVNNCSGAARKLNFTVYSTPSTPDADDQTVCYGNENVTLYADGGTGTIIWFSNAGLTDTVAFGEEYNTGNYLIGTYNYYVVEELTTSGHKCRSASDQVTQTILQLPDPPAHIGDSSICSNETKPTFTAIGQASATYRWYNWANNLVGSNVTYKPPSSLTTGQYYYYITQTVGQCTSQRDTLLFTIKPQPARPVANDTTGCYGQLIPPLKAQGTGIIWTDGDTIAYGNVFHSGKTEEDTYTYSVTQTVSGCTSNPKVVKLFIRPSPEILQVDTTQQSACNANDAAIIITASTVPVSYEQKYSIDNGNTWKNNGSFTGLRNGLYYTVVRNKWGCFDHADTVLISDIDTVPPPLVLKDTVYCSNQAPVPLYVADATSGDTLRWYKNNFNDTLHVGTFYLPQMILGQTDYYVVKERSGCESDPAVVKVIFKQQPQRPAVSDTALCEGLVVPDLLAVGENITWYPDTTDTGSPGDIYTPPVSSAGVHVFFATQTVDGCESYAAPDTLTIWPKPNANFDLNPSLGCSPLDVSVINLSNADTCYWYFHDDTVNSLSPPNYVYTNTRNQVYTYYVNLKAIAEHGCIRYGKDSVRVKPLRNYDFTLNPDTICSGETIDCISQQGGIQYMWNFGDGTNQDAGNYVIHQFTNTDPLPKSYTVTLKVRNSFGCETQTYQKTALVSPKPLADFTLDVEAGCSPFTPVVTNLSSAGTYAWTLDGDFYSSSPVPALNFINQYSFPDFHTLELAVTNAFACTSVPHIEQITVNPEMIASMGIFGDTTGCGSLQVKFFYTGRPANQWNWNFGQGQQSDVQNPPIQSYSNLYSFDTVIHYKVRLKAISNFGCAGYDSTQITVYPSPNVNFTVSESNVCAPATVICNNNSDMSLAFTWNFGDGSPDYNTNLVSVSYLYENENPFQQTLPLKLTGTSGYGCTKTVQQNITVNPTPVAGFSSVRMDSCGTSNVSFYNSTNLFSSVTYNWNFGDGSPVSATRNTSHQFVNNAFDTIGRFPVTMTAIWNNRCSDSFVDTIKVYPVPKAAFSVNQYNGCSPFNVITTNNSTGLPDDIYTWTFGDPTPDTIAFSVTHVYENYSQSNSFANLKLTSVNRYGCSDDSTVAITIYPMLQADFSVSETSGCNPLKVYFYNSSSGPGGSASLSWNFNDGTSPVAGQSNPVHTFNINSYSQPDTFTVVLTKTHGVCTSIKTKDIIVYPTPYAHYNFSPDEGCSPLFVEFNTSLSQGADSTWWVFDNNISQENDSLLVHQLYRNQSSSNPVTFRPRLTVYRTTGGTTCQSVFVDTITVYPEVTASFVTDTGKCSGLNFHFQNTGWGNQYYWYSDDLSWTSTFTNPDKAFINNSQINDTLTVTLVSILNAYQQCNDTVTKSIIVYPIPAVSFNITNPAGCSPFTVECINTSSPSFSYQWNAGTGYNEQTNDTMYFTFNIGPTQPTEKTISLKGTSLYGCSGLYSRQVTVYPEVIADFSTEPSLTQGCSPLMVRFTSQSVGFDSIIWNFGWVDTAMQNPYPLVWFTNPSYTDTTRFMAKLIAKSAWCSDTAFKTVTVYPAPKPAFSVTPYNECSPVTITILNTSQGVTQYDWDFGDNSHSTDNSPVITHTYPNPPGYNNFRLKLKGSNESGCYATQEQPIWVKPFVAASFTTSVNSGCSPLILLFQNTSQGASAFNWFINNQFDNNQFSPNILFENAKLTDSLIRIKLKVESAYGCIDSLERTITVYATPEADFSVMPNSLFITYPNMTFEFFNLTRDTTPTVWQYLWDFDDTQLSQLRQPGSHTYDTSGVYFVNLTVSGLHCQDTITRRVEIRLPPPVAGFLPDTAGCSPLTVNFRNLSLYATQFKWTFLPGLPNSSEKDPVFTFYEPGTYQVRLDVSNQAGFDFTTREIEVIQTPYADFKVAPTFIYVPGQEVKCFNQSYGGDTFLWNFGDTTTFDTIPFHQYQKAGKYNITLIAKTNTTPVCADTLTLPDVITAENAGQITLPNAFRPTPGGSNGGYYVEGGYNNNIFFPPIKRSVVEYRLVIYTRWGQKIFETTNIRQGWDGYFDGKLCKQDVYVWKVEGKYANGQTFAKMGDVTLLR